MKHTRESVIALISECRKNGTRIDLSGQDLSGLDLQDADLRWANLKEANLQGTDLRDAIAELEADNANLNDWLNAWKESFNLAQAEIAKLHADNRSLVEQMNAMALKPNQAIIEYFYPKHNPENRRIENLPTEECPCIVELYSGEYDIVWWIDDGFEETGWDGYCVDEVKSWAYLPKGVTK